MGREDQNILKEDHISFYFKQWRVHSKQLDVKNCLADFLRYETENI